MGKQNTSQEKPPMGETEIFQNGREQKLGICRRLQESRQKRKDKAGTISRHPILRYRKVKAEMNPFDPEWQEYMTWKLRAKRELTKGKTSRKAS